MAAKGAPLRSLFELPSGWRSHTRSPIMREKIIPGSVGPLPLAGVSQVGGGGGTCVTFKRRPMAELGVVPTTVPIGCCAEIDIPARADRTSERLLTIMRAYTQNDSFFLRNTQDYFGRTVTTAVSNYAGIYAVIRQRTRVGQPGFAPKPEPPHDRNVLP